MTVATAQLGDVAEFIMGQAPPGSDCNTRGEGTVFVKAGEFDERFPVVREWTTNPLKLAKDGDVLVCVVGATAGKVNQAIDCAIGRSVAAVRPALKRIDTGYLFHFLSSQVSRLRAKSQGLAQGVITKDMLGEIETPLPPLAEQRRIAVILDAADALRQKRRQALRLLDQLSQSIFIEMFGHAGRNRGDHPLVNFGDVVYFQEGPGVRNWQFRDRGVKLVNVKNIVDGNLVPDNTNRHLDPSEVEERYAHFLLELGDFVMASSGVTWGKIAEVFAAHLPLCLNTSMIRVRPLETRLRKKYLRAFIELGSFRSQIERLITGSAQPNFGPSHLRLILIPLPRIAVQEAFEQQIAALEADRHHQRQALALQDTLFASLQHRAFRGEL